MQKGPKAGTQTKNLFIKRLRVLRTPSVSVMIQMEMMHFPIAACANRSFTVAERTSREDKIGKHTKEKMWLMQTWR